MDEQTQRVLSLTSELMRAPSVTPDDAGCQALIEARLKPLGFTASYFNAGGVTNLFAVRQGDPARPHLMFAGHTDVVPPGPLEEWDSDPFVPEVRDDMLFGRGAADMKSSLAAMVVAMEDLLADGAEQPPTGTLSFLITSDEEGVATHGTQYAIKQLLDEGVQPDYCVVGEPSSSSSLGDVVRCGRRGSLNLDLTINGVQGHVAYPQDADNPVHQALGALDELTSTVWDQGNEFYPPTSFQISNIEAGTGATNVIPGKLRVLCNFRYNTEQDAAGLERKVEAVLRAHGLNFESIWQLSGPPFLTEPGNLTHAVAGAIQQHMGYATEMSTSGGTSDGRFISPWGKPGTHQVEVVELGPCNATIHKINECVAVQELAPLSRIYADIARQLVA